MHVLLQTAPTCWPSVAALHSLLHFLWHVRLFIFAWLALVYVVVVWC